MMHQITWLKKHTLHLLLCGITSILVIGCAPQPSPPSSSQYQESAQKGIVQGPAAITVTPGAPASATPTPMTAPPTAAPTGATDARITEAIAQTNKYRLQNGCAALQESSQLDQAAYGHSQDMAVRGYFAHNTPDGVTPWTRIQATGYQFSSAAENIAAGYATADAVIDAFFNEKPPNDGHRLNILNCHLTQVGIGIYYLRGSPYGTYWTQDFATPLT